MALRETLIDYRRKRIIACINILLQTSDNIKKSKTSFYKDEFRDISNSLAILEAVRQQLEKEGVITPESPRTGDDVSFKGVF